MQLVAPSLNSFSRPWGWTLFLWPALMACQAQEDVAQEYDNIVLQARPYRGQTLFLYCKSFPTGLSRGMLALAPAASAITPGNTFFASSCLTNFRIRRDTLLISLLPAPACDEDRNEGEVSGPMPVRQLRDGRPEETVDMRVDAKRQP
jgi:hypothetical protein